MSKHHPEISPEMIRTHNLTKHFGALAAVDSLSLSSSSARSATSVDHGFPAEAAPTPPARGRGSPLCFKIVIY